jgi:hypothetical protein
MKTLRLSTALVVLVLLSAFLHPLRASANGGENLLAGDALQAPPRPQALAATGSTSPSRYQPSAFLAGRVAVQLIFVESNGTLEPSTADWTKAQVAEISNEVNTALHWWGDRLPNARLSFDLTTQMVPSKYEPITHGLSTEGQWIGDAFNRMGVSATNYFDQAYAAADQLRHDRDADWATTIFVANSSGKADGRFADGHFAYAYINGPFMVVTSDAGPYGTSKLAPVVAHEFGHIFGALDQYASAGTPCTQQSGYLSVPTTNSQANNCGTRFICIMLEPLEAYSANQIDASALGQIGYRDSNNNNIPDPLDTAPVLQIQIDQPGGGRPVLSGQAVDQPFPSPTGESMTINTVSRVEYRADGGEWTPLPPQDGAYDSSAETINTTLPLYDGAHTVELRALNSIGASSAIAKYNISISGVGADPHYQLSVPKVSNKATININLVAPTGATAQISENQFLSGASWSPAQPSMAWQVGDIEGQRTLYVRFRDKNGIESPIFTRTILVDRTPPTGRALLHIKPTTWLEILASDSASTIAAVQISIDNGASGDWQAFQPSIPLTLQSNKITIRLRDEAGNVSPPIVATSVTSVWLPFINS